jgi:diguanylate cyclase (GGDEF)-like protein
MTTYHMTPPGTRIIERGFWHNMLSLPRDGAIVDAGVSGEQLVARVRLISTIALLGVPLVAFQSGLDRPENRIALGATLFGCIASLIIMAIVRRPVLPRGIAYTTSLFDVSLVTATHIGFLIQGLPSTAANSRTTFLVYFIAIGATCLRWDPRVCLAAGVTAVVQYSAVSFAALQLWSRATPDDVRMFGNFLWAQQAGRVIVLAIFSGMCVSIVQRSMRLRISSTHDPLSGLMNRAYLEERVANDIARSRRTGTPLCIAVLDVDNFKTINDRFGHEIGDAALRLLGGVLRRAIRRSDLAGRWGGEEFVIALPDTWLPEAYGKIEQLRLEVASHVIVLPGGDELRLTVSGGLADTHADGQTVEDLINAADTRMLQAKREGRNRVVVGSPVAARSGAWRVVITNDDA